MNRKQAKELLVEILEWLPRHCEPSKNIWRGTRWPDKKFLQRLEETVLFLIATQRKKTPAPTWKAFLLLDKRTKLPLLLRVNDLVKRARERLEDFSKEPLSKLSRQAEHGDDCARKLLDDIAAIREGEVVSRKIDWAQHETALKQFSRNRSVEPVFGRSERLEFRCYARTLELIIDDYRREPLRGNPYPLIEWISQIGHPDASSLLICSGFDWFLDQGSWRSETVSRKRVKVNERVRRYRERHRGKLVYPGDWIRLYPDEKMPNWKAAFKRAMDKPCELCGESMVNEPYVWVHRLSQATRCPGCQEADWWDNGYEIDELGFPSSWLGEEATREERIAERTFHLGSNAKQWLQSPEGQAWLRNLKATEVTNRPS